MRRSLIEHLCCPVCRADLQLRDEQLEGEHIMQGALLCEGCERRYLVVGGVPRLLPDQLRAELAHTSRNFGRSWKLWSQIEDERYRSQFLQWMSPLQPDDFAGKTIFDCGCGKGRHLRVVSSMGCAMAIGVDLSEAVDVAFANTHHLENVHVVQGDIYNLPLKGGFDVGYSIGVLHHTPDPEKSYHAMAAQVRPGGTVAAWVYGRENNAWIVYGVTPIRVLVTRYLPSLLVRWVSWWLALVLFVGIFCVYLPAAKLGLRLFYQDYMLNLWRLGFHETCHIVYDHLIAPTAFYLRREAVAGWVARAELEQPQITWVNRNSWALVGRKTATPRESVAARSA